MIYASNMPHIFQNKSVRMLKNILTEHTEPLPFINYKQ